MQKFSVESGVGRMETDACFVCLLSNIQEATYEIKQADIFLFACGIVQSA